MSRLPAPVRWALPVIVAGGIFYLSDQPSLDAVPPLFPMQDKVFHAVVFALLGITLALNADRSRRWSVRHGVLLAAGVSWAVLDELHQSMVPGRDCSALDLLADLVGLSVAFLLYSRGRRAGEKHGRNRTGRAGRGS